ncbi:MAG: restriction endonuclease, partial [bacterium]
MARRRHKPQGDLELGLAGLGILVISALALSGLLPTVLYGLLTLGTLALAVFVMVYLFKDQTNHPHNFDTPPVPSSPPPTAIDVTCPLCKVVLTAPASISGHTVCCEGCRHVFELPKPTITRPDATSFYFPPKPKGFTQQLLSELEWKRFENLVEGYFSAIGLKTRPNRPGADGGVDIHLLHPDTNQVGSIVQCKSWHV